MEAESDSPQSEQTGCLSLSREAEGSNSEAVNELSDWDLSPDEDTVPNHTEPSETVTSLCFNLPFVSHSKAFLMTCNDLLHSLYFYSLMYKYEALPLSIIIILSLLNCSQN